MYKSVSKLGGSPPPLELQVLLSVPDLTNNQVLVHHPPNASRVRVDPTPTHILLESWKISFSATPGSEASSRTSSYASSGGSSPVGPEVTPATVYKHAIATFRSMYSLLRVLPAWRLCKRPRRSRSGNLSIALRMRVRDSGASEDWEGTEEVMRVLGFGMSHHNLCHALSSKAVLLHLSFHFAHALYTSSRFSSLFNFPSTANGYFCF